jgi:adenosylcobinamide-phosphate synthase
MIDVHDRLFLLVLALALEGIFAYPAPVFRTIGHPVSWIGALISALERRWNVLARAAETRKVLGCGLVAVLLALSIGIGILVEQFATLSPPFTYAVALASVFALVAAGSLDQHVRAVPKALAQDGLPGGRRSVAMIVGRDPSVLDEAGVSRAAIESLAENASDGVVAPALWFVFLGLPGIIAYKAINTADSMIGHRSERYLAFGWAAARLDDLFNLPASRLTALLFVLAAAVLPGTSANGAYQAVLRDAGKHRSPNAGWPEAAMAGALGLRLAGPRVYGATLVDDHWMGSGSAEANADDILRALALYRVAMALGVMLVLVAALILWPG